MWQEEVRFFSAPSVVLIIIPLEKQKQKQKEQEQILDTILPLMLVTFSDELLEPTIVINYHRCLVSRSA
jgi:hypothetical protein